MTSIRRRVFAAMLLLAALTTPAGCASLPPARPVTDMALIAGKWQGQITFARSSYQLFYLTIEPSGRVVASWDGVTRYGQVTLSGARPRVSLYIWSATLDYLEGSGQRVILLKEDFGAWDAIVRPLT